MSVSTDPTEILKQDGGNVSFSLTETEGGLLCVGMNYGLQSWALADTYGFRDCIITQERLDNEGIHSLSGPPIDPILTMSGNRMIYNTDLPLAVGVFIPTDDYDRIAWSANFPILEYSGQPLDLLAGMDVDIGETELLTRYVQMRFRGSRWAQSSVMDGIMAYKAVREFKDNFDIDAIVGPPVLWKKSLRENKIHLAHDHGVLGVYIPAERLDPFLGKKA